MNHNIILDNFYYVSLKYTIDESFLKQVLKSNIHKYS